MTDDLSTSLADELAGLCDNCWRPVASEADWAAHESGDYEGDGSDKCWDHVCYGSDLKVTDVLAPFVESLLNAAKAEALREAADEVKSIRTGYSAPTIRSLTSIKKWLRERADLIEEG